MNNNQIIALMDLTSLNDNDNKKSIEQLCNNSFNNIYSVASVCVYAQFVPQVKNFLKKYNQVINVTTVINFPNGEINLYSTLQELEKALTDGANEIDMVIPYQQLITNPNDFSSIENFISEIRKNCNKHVLKIILETGKLKEEKLIRLASKLSINQGADFIKTSTGKIAINATPTAAKYMLEEIKHNNSKCGFKAAGGIKTKQDALEYITLATTLLGENFIKPQTFRLGASSLLNNLLEKSINPSDY